jgi:hypothetical protein
MQGEALVFVAFFMLFFAFLVAHALKFTLFLIQVYWPDDRDWYTGVISKYNAETGTHRVSFVCVFLICHPFFMVTI